MAKITRAGLCRAMRYVPEADAASVPVYDRCNCQNFTNSLFTPVMTVPKEPVTIDHTLTTFKGVEGQAILQRFCPERRLAGWRGTRDATRIVTFNLGTFDEPAVATPTREINDALPRVCGAGVTPGCTKRLG